MHRFLRLSVFSVSVMTALPALAEEGDPLANSVLLPGWVGFALLGLAILLVIILRVWSSRGPS